FATSFPTTLSAESTRAPAEVHHDRRAGECAAARTEKERRHLRDVLRLDEPFDRLRGEDDVLEDALLRPVVRLGLGCDLGLDERRLYVSRTDGRRGDAEGRTFEGDRLHESEDPVLGGNVADLEGRRDEAMDRSHHEKPPIAAR